MFGLTRIFSKGSGTHGIIRPNGLFITAVEQNRCAVGSGRLSLACQAALAISLTLSRRSLIRQRSSLIQQTQRIADRGQLSKDSEEAPGAEIMFVTKRTFFSLKGASHDYSSSTHDRRPATAQPIGAHHQDLHRLRRPLRPAFPKVSRVARAGRDSSVPS